MLYAEEAEAINRHIMMAYMMLWKGRQIHKPKQQIIQKRAGG